MTHSPDAAPRPQPSPEYIRAHELFFGAAARAMAAIVTFPERAESLDWHLNIPLATHVPGLKVAFNNLHYSQGNERYVLVQQEGRDDHIGALIAYHVTKLSHATERAEGIRATDDGLMQVASGRIPSGIGAEVQLPWTAVPGDDVEQINTLTTSSLHQVIIDLDRALHP